MRINHLVFPTVTPAQNKTVQSEPKPALDAALQTGLSTQSKNPAKAESERPGLRTTPLATSRTTPPAKPLVKPEPVAEAGSRVIYTPADPVAKKTLLDKLQEVERKPVKPLDSSLKAESPTVEPIKPEAVKNLSLEGQLEMGKKMGLFTHITISKDGVLSARPERAKTVASQEFVSSAVTTMKDFADGIALLKKNSGEAAALATTPAVQQAEPAEIAMAKPSPFQQIAARLNLFA